MDEEEDRLYGPDRRGDELPVELSKKESRLARLRDAMQRLEEKQQDQKLQDREEAEEAAGQKKRGRIAKGAGFKDLMERRLLTKRGKRAYKQRGQTIEAVFGQMATRGLARFCLRGPALAEAGDRTGKK